MVDPATESEISGIDFVSEFRAVITTQANNTGVRAAGNVGYSFNRPSAPAGDAQQPPSASGAASPAEQR